MWNKIESNEENNHISNKFKTYKTHNECNPAMRVELHNHEAIVADAKHLLFTVYGELMNE